MEAGGRRIALALGSGGARGYAHIGAIHVLRERDYEIISVAGSSMGALVGGLFAAGKLDPFTEWVTSVGQGDVLRSLDPTMARSGMIKANKIVGQLRRMLEGALIEDLPIAFTAVATDLLARKAVWFQQGPVDVAIRASIAMPGVITPVVRNGRLLADGGLVDPVPILAAASAQADMTIAISLTGERTGHFGGSPIRESAAARPIEEWLERFHRAAGQWLDKESVRSLSDWVKSQTQSLRHSIGSHADESAEPLPPGLGLREVMNLSLEAMQDLVTRYRLAGYPPDVLISVPKDVCQTMEFHRATEMIELGRRLTIEALDAG